jgi:glycosyltransferase involved in cell wall biosynthesis
MKANTVYILSREPLVVTGGFGTLLHLHTIRRPFTFLYHNCGWIRARGLWRYVKNSLPYRGRKRLIVMTNEPSEARWLRLIGLEAYPSSHNLHVCESWFRPSVSVGKRYDAVYVAQLEPFKRLHLAEAVQSLCVVTYKNGHESFDLHSYEPRLHHADFNRTFIPPEQVREIYNASRVGLALSPREGAMFASMEYLMCGLPVVTTPNRGGRNRYFTPRNSRFVAPRPDAVAAAVADYVSTPPDPFAIRDEVLDLVHRDRLAYVQILAQRCGVPVSSLEGEVERLWGGERGIASHAMPLHDFLSRFSDG